MQAIYYEITDTNVPGLVKNFHRNLHFGYAYETATHYVHFYGAGGYFFSIHTGQTVVENKATSAYKTLREWVEHYFGATNIHGMATTVGHSVEGVWRPELCYFDDTYQALKTSEADRKLSEQALRVLLEKLDDIFLYIEPDPISFGTYSHKIRELLILACTEVENFWTYYMTLSGTAPRGKNYNTQDYVKLKEKLFLAQYQFSLRSFVSVSPIVPFDAWDPAAPTASLPWYEAYNQTKHNRAGNFADATFLNCLIAVVACLVLYIVRFSPYPLLEEKGPLNSLVNQHFKFELINVEVKNSYIPLLNIPAHYRTDIIPYDSKQAGDVQPYVVDRLIL